MALFTIAAIILAKAAAAASAAAAVAAANAPLILGVAAGAKGAFDSVEAERGARGAKRGLRRQGERVKFERDNAVEAREEKAARLLARQRAAIGGAGLTGAGSSGALLAQTNADVVEETSLIRETALLDILELDRSKDSASKAAHTANASIGPNAVLGFISGYTAGAGLTAAFAPAAAAEVTVVEVGKQGVTQGLQAGAQVGGGIAGGITSGFTAGGGVGALGPFAPVAAPILTSAQAGAVGAPLVAPIAGPTTRQFALPGAFNLSAF